MKLAEKNFRLDSVALYIWNTVGSHDWEDHVYSISSYFAVFLDVSEEKFRNDLMRRIKKIDKYG